MSIKRMYSELQIRIRRRRWFSHVLVTNGISDLQIPVLDLD